MSPCLEDCPPEIIETLVSLLDLDDICRLRQTSRSLAAKSSQSRFKAFFRFKKVLLSEASLRAFREVTQSGRLGCLLQNLVLVGLTNNSAAISRSEAEESLDETLYDLLSHAFRNMKANSKGRELLSLSLRVEVPQKEGEPRLPPSALPCDDWRLVWRSSACTCSIAMRASTAARLPVATLIVYNNGEQQFCSLACDELGNLPLLDGGLSVVLSRSSLYLSVCRTGPSSLPARQLIHKRPMFA